MKYELELATPWLNAAGMLGYAPDRRLPVDWSRLGAFVTHPISLAPRTPARGDRFLPFNGGFLLHTGYPNPGVSRVIKRFGRQWARSPLPVWVHLLVQEPGEAGALVERFENLPGVAALEIGLPPDAGPDLAHAISVSAAGELPLILRMPPEKGAEIAAALDPELVAAVSLAPVRGVMPGGAGELTGGRLYGPALYPQTLAALQQLVPLGFPVIAGGGVYTEAQGEALLSAGAWAVQLDAVLWRGDLFFNAPTRS